MSYKKPIKLKHNDERRPPELQSKAKKSGKNSAQSSAKNSVKNTAQNSAKNSAQSSTKNSVQKSAQNSAKKSTQNSVKNGTQSSTKNTTRNSAKTEKEKRLEKQKNAILRITRKREKFLCRLNVSVIIAIFAFFTLFLILGERPTEDEDERRKLATMPEFTWASYFDGSFTGGVSEFFNDAVPNRSSFKNFISLFRSNLGIGYDDGVEIIGKLPVIDDEPNPGESDPPPATSTPSSGGDTTSDSQPTQTPQQSTTVEKPNTPEPADADGDMSGTVFVLGDGRGFAVFGGGKAGGKDYAETVNKFKAELGEGVNIYSMVIPTSGSFYLPKKYQNIMASEWDNIENINDYLVGVTPIDAYTALSKHTDEYIYFRTDHHWTQLGAYYAAEEFAKVAGVPFAPLSSYETTVREGMLGSLYGYSKNNVNMKKNPDTFTFYKPTNDFTVTVYDPDYTNPHKLPLILDDAHYSVNNSYMVYGGDIQINHVQTDCDNGRRLVIIGDSYDNAMFLNLTNSFSEIWVVDMRAKLKYFDLNIIDFIQKMNATDVLFAMDTFSAVGTNREGLKVMLENKKTLPAQ